MGQDSSLGVTGRWGRADAGQESVDRPGNALGRRAGQHRVDVGGDVRRDVWVGGPKGVLQRVQLHLAIGRSVDVARCRGAVLGGVRGDVQQEQVDAPGGPPGRDASLEEKSEDPVVEPYRVRPCWSQDER